MKFTYFWVRITHLTLDPYVGYNNWGSSLDVLIGGPCFTRICSPKTCMFVLVNNFIIIIIIIIIIHKTIVA